MTPEESRLLVVDDNEVNRDMLSRRFKRRGFNVEVAAHGRQALEMIEASSFDLILLDIMMPVLNGLEVLKILRQTYSTTELPIIMATAKDRSEDMVEALELGANDYVTKPIDFPVVLARVQSHLRQKVAAAPKSSDQEPGLQEIGPGAVLAEKYRLEELLGSGSFGAVYKARHLSLEHQVAIKVLQTNMAPASEALARFRREGISACRVKHPNAVSVLDFGVTSTGTAYLVMELLEGRPFSDELKENGMLHPIRCVQILRPICEVLAEVHAAGIVHRDIKPANIFLHQGRAGEIIKVLDFGIAKFVGDVTGEEHLTVDGSILGTPTYMAPERFGNDTYDGRADVYSLGILLYRMLGGRVPFQSKDLVAMAMQHMRDAPPSLRELNPNVSPELEAVVLHAMSKKMEDRPSAAELAKRFGQALGRRASDAPRAKSAAPPSPPPGARSEAPSPRPLAPLDGAEPRELTIPPLEQSAMKETPAVEEEPPTVAEPQSLAELAAAAPRPARPRPEAAEDAGPNEGKGGVLRLFDKLFDTDD